MHVHMMHMYRCAMLYAVIVAQLYLNNVVEPIEAPCSEALKLSVDVTLHMTLYICKCCGVNI